VGGWLIRDAQLGTGGAPGGTMGRDPAAAGAVEGDQVGELMAHGALELAGQGGEERIELNAPSGIEGAACGRAKARVPGDVEAVAGWDTEVLEGVEGELVEWFEGRELAGLGGGLPGLEAVVEGEEGELDGRGWIWGGHWAG